jgi:hypothetical protein
MTHRDVTRHQAQVLLTREATLAAHYGRLFEQAAANGDLAAARRWNRQYRPSEFRCRTLGTLLRAPATTTTRSTDHPQHDAHRNVRGYHAAQDHAPTTPSRRFTAAH